MTAHRIAAADDKLIKKEHINLFSLLGPGMTVSQTIIDAIIGACNFYELLAILNHFCNQSIKKECKNNQGTTHSEKCAERASNSVIARANREDWGDGKTLRWQNSSAFRRPPETGGGSA